MKKHQILALIVGTLLPLTVAQGQTYTDYTTPLNITTATDYTEAYVNRTTNATTGSSIYLDSDNASYNGRNINITNNATMSGYGIRSNNAKTIKSINITADEGTWSTITLNRMIANGINISNTTETSTITNTRFYCLGAGSTGISTGNSTTIAPVVELDNVEIYLSGAGNSGTGLYLNQYGIITNAGKRGITITADAAGTASAIVSLGGTADIHHANINIAKTGSRGILHVGYVPAVGYTPATISLSDSQITSGNGNILIGCDNGAHTVNLDKINLGNAKNQAILITPSSATDAQLLVNLTNGTNFDGYTNNNNGIGQINLNIQTGASWNVTQNSLLGDASTLTLGAGSTISFDQLTQGTFTNINAATIALETGSILMLGATAAEIQALIDGNDGQYSTQLFTTNTAYSNNGVTLRTSDGAQLQYTTDNLGTYTLTGILPASIPEPATTTLGLASLALLTLRRKK